MAVTGCDPKSATHQAPPASPALASLPGADAPAEKPADLPPALNSVPLRSIASLKRSATSGDHKPWVRVSGTVLDERPGEYIVVHDDTGTLFAETRQLILPQLKQRVDVLGQPVSDGYSVSLQNATAIDLATNPSVSSAASASVDQPTKLPLLTKAWEIRDLPAEKVAWHYPVRLRAVVTVNTKLGRWIFVQDDSAGISVLLNTIGTNLNPGDLVNLEGVSDPGGFSPIVVASNVTVIGSAPLPEPQPETLFQLATGQYGSQWIEVRGVVRSMSCSNGLSKLNLNDASGVITVNIPSTNKPAYLLDATVRIRGACGSKSNNKRQFVNCELWASSLADVQVEEPGEADPLSLPVKPIASMSQFHPRQTLQHRINFAGVVTYADPDFFFIQDADTGVRVNAEVNGRLHPGDYVMVAGYPGLGDYGYLLQDSVFKVVSHRSMPAPKTIATEKPLDPQLHDLWVQVNARFLRYSKIGAVDVLTLQVGNRVFDARTLTPVSSRIKNLQPGSLLQVTGLYRVLADEARVPKSLQLAVPSEHDVQILEEPSWWSSQNTINVVCGMAIIIGATVLWVLMLRRKVQSQTASLQQSEQKFRSLVEQSLVGVYIVQDERFVYINPRMVHIFGYASAEEMAACGLQEMIFEEDLPLVREQIRRRIDEQVEFTHYFFRGRRKDGFTIHVEVLGSRTEFNGKPAVLGMLLDVTERKLAQDKIAEQARMLDLASDAIVVSDLADRVLYWNQSAQRIYGWTPQQAVGGLSQEMMHVSLVEFKKAKDALLQDFNWHGEFIHRDRQGGEITVAARWTLVHDQEGNPESILAINTDITQSKKMEAQFLRTQRLESIGVLAGGIAHDLNNVLAPIFMACHLLELESDAAERAILLKSILASTQRAADLVKQILTFARGTDGRRLVVYPHQLLDELRKILGETLPKSIHLRIHSAADVWPILADATQLHQVLMNFCINARDAMPSGGELTVDVASLDLSTQDPLTTGKLKPGPYVVFTVTDTGTGMPPGIRERIFDPFFTTKEVGKGTGLGLSTSLGIVKSHGGFINVTSEVGQGSCFKVYVPALDPGQQAAVLPAGENSAVIRGNDELILVVDDETALRNIAKRTLQMFGYRVITAANGEEAVICYREQKKQIALVVMDMMMPVLDGPAAIEVMTGINPEVKIIAVSGLTNESQLTSPAIQVFLPKPYTAEEMLNAINRVLHSKPVSRPVAS